jgi:hypothetical protein
MTEVEREAFWDELATKGWAGEDERRGVDGRGVSGGSVCVSECSSGPTRTEVLEGASVDCNYRLGRSTDQ